MLNLTRPLVILDVETTGTHPQVDRVVQVGLVKIYPDGREVPWKTLINPCIPIPPEVTVGCHGISDADVVDAPRFKEIAPVLAGGIKDSDVGGFNVMFDLQFLREEFRRVGGRTVLDHVRVVDVFRIYKQKHPRSLGDAVREYLGHDLEGAHDALVDAQATVAVLKAQLERHPDLPTTVDEMHKVFFETPADGFLDADGKLAWRYGRATINFGKNATMPLEFADPGYLRWILNGDFSDSVKRIVRAALNGQFPRKG
jgi:DNA polymerase-3 subunit epsilon